MNLTFRANLPKSVIAHDSKNVIFVICYFRIVLQEGTGVIDCLGGINFKLKYIINF